MKTTSRLQRPIGLVFLAAGLLALATACNIGDLPSGESADKSETETSRQTLGESSQAFTFDGPGSETIPSYSERVAQHLVNRMRTDPEAYDLTDQDGNLLPPDLPALLDPGMIEAGRWQGQHAIANRCECPTSAMEQPAAFNSCCTVVRDNGQVRCASNRVACDAPQASTEQERWDVLESGSANITFETYFQAEMERSEAPAALPGELLAAQLAESPTIMMGSPAFAVSQVAQPKPSDACLPPVEPCDKGACTDPLTGSVTCDPEENPDCQGYCWGGHSGECDGFCTGEESEDPVTCELPNPSEQSGDCNPSEYPIGYYVSILHGRTDLPMPTLMNGIHMKLGDGQTSMFGTTPADKLNFSIHYFDPNGDANQSNLVIGGQCHSLQVQKRNGNAAMPRGPDAGNSADEDAGSDESEYYGLRYGKNVSLEQGCHRYVFSFTDPDGFVHTYPSYGSLGARAITQQDGDGNTVVLPAFNNSDCPIWSPQRPSTSCLPEGEQCVTGETRSCYTGRANTRGRGICTIGTESCENGRWTGVCEGQTTPEAQETCGDNLDNNCNGSVDEGCGTPGGPGGGDPGSDPDDEDAGGNQQPDGGSSSADGSSNSGADAGDQVQLGNGDSGGGCSTGGDELPPASPSALLVLLGAAFLRRRNL